MKNYYITFMFILVAGSLQADGDLFTNYGRYVSKVPLKEVLDTQYNLNPADYKKYLDFLNASAHANVRTLKAWYERLREKSKQGNYIPEEVLDVAKKLALKSYHGNTMESIGILEKIAALK